MSIKDNPTGSASTSSILRRRRMYLLTIIPAAVLLAVYLAYALPPSYRPSATILLEPSSIPTELVQTTVTSYADQQIELVSRRVLTPENVEQVVARDRSVSRVNGLSTRDKARQIVAETVIERVDPNHA